MVMAAGELRSIHTGRFNSIKQRLTGRQPGPGEEFPHMQPDADNVSSMFIQHPREGTPAQQTRTNVIPMRPRTPEDPTPTPPAA